MTHVLDSKNRRRVKYCPCGKKDNKDGKFVPFENAEKFGYCHSCDEWYNPENKTVLSWKPERVNRTPKEKPEFISWDYYKPLLYDYHLNDNNRFVTFLQRTLGVNATHIILQEYMLGTKDLNVIFPYLNHKAQIVNLKTMDYDHMTGKRGNVIFYDNRKPRHKMCLFGEHLINVSKHQDKPIAIVESEKTACLMSYFHPGYLWLACGGSNGLMSYKFNVLKYRDVCLFPDQGKFDMWTEKLERLSDIHSMVKFEISKECELWYNDGDIKEGEDIADYYLRL